MPIVRPKIDAAGTVGHEAWREIKQFDQIQSADFGNNGDDSDVDNVIAFGFDWSRPAKLPDCRLHGSYP